MAVDRYVKGAWNALCDLCHFKYKSYELKPGIDRQQGLMLCKDCWDEPQPQDHLRVRPDRQEVPWTRPEPTDTFLTDTTTASLGLAPIAGIAIAGLAVVGTPPGVSSVDDSFTNPLQTGTFSSNNSTL